MGNGAESFDRLVVLAGTIAAGVPGLTQARDQITDPDDLAMLDWIASSSVSLQDLTGQVRAAGCLTRSQRHALRNCLNAVKGGSQLIVEGAPDNGLDPSGTAVGCAENLIAQADGFLTCLDTVPVVDALA